jgi:hypothetical protein
MSVPPVIRLHLASPSADAQRILVDYRAGEKHLNASVDIGRLFTPEEEESVRWYLEEYPKFPFEPATTIAKNIGTRVRQLGENLFDQIFNSTVERSELWALAEEHLETLRVEIIGDNSRFAAPWESLWNPLDTMPLACRAASFVRSGAYTDVPPARNTASAIRILIVISRPAGILDAPFRSVAVRLLDRVGDDRRFHFEVLRPPTFEALQSTLQAAADQGRPYTVVHFDGHGVHEDLAAQREYRPARRRRGYLLFETPGNPDRPDYIDASTLGDALAAGRVPIVILNACRSARMEIWTEQMGSRRPFGSLADELLALGQPAVLAMQYNIQVETASQFVADLYQGLAHGSLAEAVQVGRRNLFRADRIAPHQHLKIHDWLVPVLLERYPCCPLLDAAPQPLNRRHSRTTDDTIVGADDTLMAIERAFQSAPVVVLSGPVGSGKTRLANEFAAWDARTRENEDRARSPLHLRGTAGTDSAELTSLEGRTLIETRNAKFSPAVKHAVVQVPSLHVLECIALMRRRLPDSAAFEPAHWQPVVAFSQGNPGVLLSIAAIIARADADDPSAILEIVRSQPVGIEANDFTAALSALDRDDIDCLAIAALFEGPVSSRLLRMLASVGSEAPKVLEDANALFDHLSELGLVTPLGSSYYRMHPGLPGLLRPEFERRYPGVLGERIRGAIINWFAAVCAIFYRYADSGERNAYEIQDQTLSVIEPTVWRVLDQAVAAEDWPGSRNLAAALRRILTQHGRRSEWQRLATRLHSLVPEDASGDPPAERKSLWHLLQEDRVEHLMRIHSLAEAMWLQARLLRQVRHEHAHLDGPSADQFANEVLIPQLRRMGDIRREQRHPDAVQDYLEALQISQRLRSAIQEQKIAAQLADFYLSQKPIERNELSYWFTYASELCPPHDRIGRAQLKILSGKMELELSNPTKAAQELRDALTGLLPADPSDERAECELMLGQALFDSQRNVSESMQHVQSAIAWYDKDQNVFWASCARLNASRILSESGEKRRAFFYAQEAARGFASLAPHAEREAVQADQFATTLGNKERQETTHEQVAL